MARKGKSDDPGRPALHVPGEDTLNSKHLSRPCLESLFASQGTPAAPHDRLSGYSPLQTGSLKATAHLKRSLLNLRPSSSRQPSQPCHLLRPYSPPRSPSCSGSTTQSCWRVCTQNEVMLSADQNIRRYECRGWSTTRRSCDQRRYAFEPRTYELGLDVLLVSKVALVSLAECARAQRSCRTISTSSRVTSRTRTRRSASTCLSHKSVAMPGRRM